VAGRAGPPGRPRVWLGWVKPQTVFPKPPFQYNGNARSPWPGGNGPVHVDDLQKADYYLFHWQVRAIQRLAREHGRSPSAEVRELLTRALAAVGAGPPERPDPPAPALG
jgi:hypothetical protein